MGSYLLSGDLYRLLLTLQAILSASQLIETVDILIPGTL